MLKMHITETIFTFLTNEFTVNFLNANIFAASIKKLSISITYQSR